MSRKVKTKVSHVEAHDECGKKVDFKITHRALYYGTKWDMDNIEKTLSPATKDRIDRDFYEMTDFNEAMIFNWTDKEEIADWIERLEKKGGKIQLKTKKLKL